MSPSDVEMKAQAWDDLVAVLRRGGEAALAFNARTILARADRIDRSAAVPEAVHPQPTVAEPIHTGGCTRVYDGTVPGGRCVGYHCPVCGLPCSSQGHGSADACIRATEAHRALEMRAREEGHRA